MSTVTNPEGSFFQQVATTARSVTEDKNWWWILGAVAAGIVAIVVVLTLMFTVGQEEPSHSSSHSSLEYYDGDLLGYNYIRQCSDDHVYEINQQNNVLAYAYGPSSVQPHNLIQQCHTINILPGSYSGSQLAEEINRQSVNGPVPINVSYDSCEHRFSFNIPGYYWTLCDDLALAHLLGLSSLQNQWMFGARSGDKAH